MEGTDGKPAGREEERPEGRKERGSSAEATVRRKREESRKEEQRLSSQNPKLKRPKGSENSGGQKVNGKKRKRKEVEPREARKRKLESKGEPEEAAAEIEAGGRRKEIADEAIRGTACVEVARPKPPFHEAWRKAKQSRSKDRGFFVLYGQKRTARRPPNKIIISQKKTCVHSQLFQHFASISMEHPNLKNAHSGVIMKIQKRSESNVLSKLPINQIYRKYEVT